MQVFREKILPKAQKYDELYTKIVAATNFHAKKQHIKIFSRHTCLHYIKIS